MLRSWVCFYLNHSLPWPFEQHKLTQADIVTLALWLVSLNSVLRWLPCSFRIGLFRSEWPWAVSVSFIQTERKEESELLLHFLLRSFRLRNRFVCRSSNTSNDP